jgi:hypothetical protein
MKTGFAFFQKEDLGSVLRSMSLEAAAAVIVESGEGAALVV